MNKAMSNALGLALANRNVTTASILQALFAQRAHYVEVNPAVSVTKLPTAEQIHEYAKQCFACFAVHRARCKNTAANEKLKLALEERLALTATEFMNAATPAAIKAKRVEPKLITVPMAQATDAELQIAASSLKSDNINVQKAVDAAKLTPNVRAKLVKFMIKCGYPRIRIDAHNRVTNPDALVDFEIARPLS